MKITKERKYVVNMGNYESFTFGATVEVDTDKVGHGINEDPVTAATQCADAYLTMILAKELKEAAEVSGTPNTFILTMEL